MKKDPWWKDGVRFQCQGSGKCCVSHGEYGYVYLTLADRRRLAAHLKLTTAEFTRQYCDKHDGFYHLRDLPDARACRFLEGRRCGVYEARPTQCRTWPFWPDVMGPKTWARDVAAFCPGIGKGPVLSREQIEEQRALHSQMEDALQSEAIRGRNQ